MSAEAESAPPPLRLVGGANFSTWPDLKWTRGNSYLTMLQSRFMEWHFSVPITIEGVLRDDRQTIDLVTRIPRGIPTQEWALTIGDAVHNLRSALDAVAWGMANFGDSKPTEPRKVTFPIAETPKQWRNALDAWVADIDPEFQKRIKALQPFTHVPEGGEAGLAMLHKLDIQDKHRDFVTVSVDSEGFDLSGAFSYEYDDVVASPRLEMRQDVRLVDGLTVGTLHAGAPVKAPVDFQLRPNLTMLIEHNGQKHAALFILSEIANLARGALDVLMTGIAEEERPGDWQDMDVTLTPPED